MVIATEHRWRSIYTSKSKMLLVTFRIKRINGHKSDICQNKNKPVAKHFNLPKHSVSHLQASILKRTYTSRKQRQIEEQKLISKFNCIQEELKQASGFLSHYLKNNN